MQYHFSKIILFFLVALLPPCEGKAQNSIAQKADSLFSQKKYVEAIKLYEALHSDPAVDNEAISLKLAYIYEQLKDYPRTLYYLNSNYYLNYKEVVAQHIQKIANDHHYQGYEQNDLNFFLKSVQQYFLTLIFAVVLIATSILAILYRKIKKKEQVSKRHFVLTFSLFFFLLFLINSNITIQKAILKNRALLRETPSMAASGYQIIEPGHSVNVIGQKGIWLKVIKDRNLLYLNRKDVWLIKNNFWN